VRVRISKSRLLASVALVALAAGPVAAETAGKSDTGPDPLRLITETSPSGAYLAGRSALTGQDVGAASRYFDRVLAADPDDPVILQRAFRLRLEDGRFAAAVSLAPRVVDVHDDEASVARLTLVVDAMVRDDPETALALLDTLPGSRLNQIVGPLLGAWAALGTGNAAAAQSRLDDLRENAAVQGIFVVHAGLLAEAIGDQAAARAHYQSLMTGDDALSLRLLLVAARQRVREGKLEEALALVAERATSATDRQGVEAELTALAEAPEQARRITPALGMAEALFDLATALNRERGQTSAMMLTRLALALKADFEPALLLAAEILDNQGQEDRALALARSIPMNSAYAFMARVREADCLVDLERTDDAADVLRRFAKARPALAGPMSQLGDLEREQKNWPGAIDAYRAAIERMGDAADRRWWIHYALGIALERAKLWDAAETAFRKALSIDPDQPYVLNYLGYSWIDRGENLAEAMEMIETAVGLRPEDGYIVDSLGWALYRLEDFQGAVRHLERAVELRPTDPTINDHLGDAYWRVGRLQEARFQWRRALGFDPEPEQVDTIQQKLDSGLPALSGTDGSDKPSRG